MRLFMTGATGALGPHTLRALLAADHDVRAVARTPEKAERLRVLGAEPVTVDLFDARAVHDAVVGTEGVLHLATNVPPMSKMAFPPAWRMHNRLRTEATANLLAASRAHGIKRFVKESVTFVYPNLGDTWIDESVEPEPAPLLLPTLEGERMVTDFTVEGGEGVVLRFGLFYGPESRSTEDGIRLGKRRLTQMAGSPDAYQSSIHLEDVATAVAAAVTVAPGIYNVVDDDPLTRRAYADAFAAAFDLKPPHLAPAGLLRMTAGRNAKALTGSQRVSNAKLREASGWAPAYPSAREGWAAAGAARKVTSKERT